MKHPKNAGAFTLIELLIVIAIIGILSSVVLVSLNGARDKARDAAKIATIRQMQSALELYYSDKETYNPPAQWWYWWYQPGCGDSSHQINTFLSGYYQLLQETDCNHQILFTGSGGLAGGYQYYILFQPYSSSTLSLPGNARCYDPYTPNVYYCVVKQ